MKRRHVLICGPRWGRGRAWWRTFPCQRLVSFVVSRRCLVAEKSLWGGGGTADLYRHEWRSTCCHLIHQVLLMYSTSGTTGTASTDCDPIRTSKWVDGQMLRYWSVIAVILTKKYTFYTFLYILYIKIHIYSTYICIYIYCTYTVNTVYPSMSTTQQNLL